MNVLVLQHAPFEGPGSIAPWLRKRGAFVRRAFFYKAPDLPDPKEVDPAIAMGGPMSVHDEETFPCLREEKRFLREAIDRGAAALGVCLEAQLLAVALGSQVVPTSLTCARSPA